MAGDEYLFTSESVTEGHPDKIADQISDAILDAFLAEDPDAAVSPAKRSLTTGLVVVAGEITTNSTSTFPSMVREHDHVHRLQQRANTASTPRPAP